MIFPALAAAVIIALILGFSPMAQGQPAEKARRVGILFTLPRSDPINARLRDALVGGLRDHGWEEGKNIVLEERFAGDDSVRFRELAAELVALSVDSS